LSVPERPAYDLVALDDFRPAAIAGDELWGASALAQHPIITTRRRVSSPDGKASIGPLNVNAM